MQMSLLSACGMEWFSGVRNLPDLFNQILKNPEEKGERT